MNDSDGFLCYQTEVTSLQLVQSNPLLLPALCEAEGEIGATPPCQQI